MKVLLVYVILLGSIYTNTNSDETLRSSPGFRKACFKDKTNEIRTNQIDTSIKLAHLRIKLEEKGINAYLITSDDEHQSEYVAPHDRRLEYISGFSGNRGDGIVTLKKAALWTGGRYHIQADEQLSCNWTLMRVGQKNVSTIPQWLGEHLVNGIIGADPKLVPASFWEALKYELNESSPLIKLVAINENLIDSIWNKSPETREGKDVIIWPLKYAGQSWTSKIDETRNKMRSKGVDAMIITALDEIAWLFNIRGRDIPHRPFVYSYVILTHYNITLYIDNYKLQKNSVASYLYIGRGKGSYSVTIDDYNNIWTELPKAAETWQRVLLPWQNAFSAGASQKIYSLIPERKRVPNPSPIIFLKAEKSKDEIAGMEQAYIRDGVIMCKFFAYFESQLENFTAWSELDIVKYLHTYRIKEEMFFNTSSAATTVAFGPNGAQPSYRPTSTKNAKLFSNNTLIIDSGGEYYDGTTNVARTLHLGIPTKEQMEAYTRILMGLIQLCTLTFPSNMTSSVADILTRAPLWAAGFDYLHDSGHDIGSLLAVHESPVVLDYKTSAQHLFHAGYFISVEPAFYKEDNFGIRLGNVMEVVKKPGLQRTNGQEFLGFKDVTLVPYEPKLINTELLSVHQIRWLNDYNSKIRELVGKKLKENSEEEAFYWMMEKTKHIPGISNSLNCQSLLHILTQTTLILLILNIF